MNSKTLFLVAFLAAVLSNVSGVSGRNLYAQIAKESKAFAELIVDAGMKEELSNTNFNGTVLIPDELFNYNFVKKYGAAIQNNKVELAKIVKLHMLPDTNIYNLTVRSRIVDTALPGETVEIYRSPYGTHPTRIFYGKDIGNRGKNATDFSRVLKKAKLGTKQTTTGGTTYTANINNVVKPVNSSLYLALPAQQLCSTLTNSYGRCSVLANIESAMQTAGSTLLACSVGPNGNQVMPQVQLNPLNDLRPLPPSFSLSQIAAEGASLYWLYQMIQNLESWSVCSINSPSSVYQVPAGWELISTVPLPQGNFSPPSIQFMAIMLNRQTSHLVILNRGTMSAYEWLVDFTYNQTTQTLPQLLPSSVHQGFASTFNLMWNADNGVLETLQDLVINQNLVQYITISGHSLGAGVASLMSYATQQYLQSNGFGNITIDAPLFAPPNVGPPSFAQAFNQNVNGRRMAFLYDIVPEVPCDPSMFTCKTPIVNGFPIVTNQPGNVNSWAYTEVGGTVSITPSVMPFDSSSWAQLVNIPLNANASGFLMATHVCSYLCYFSQYSGNLNGEWCWLSQAPVGSSGSQCITFPKSNGYPS